uniref:Cytochrome c oxidase subunit 2 n=1 Tax=Ophiocordycipitaceae sp. TaxID=1907519 RepID=A0A7S8CTT4_9HYPO|nr:cytochrome c oxidase subunit II [Ophiocordycipitaceae sp.]QUT09483.1 cytochrome c oxidase subunit II [Ophiocordycipitaceae sp.]QUT09511.1 cytochrome c oxidase subunit II [Ophiocordycipitaceae sp.]QUT13241.1 cytochrome c oxidase subunit II [Ophiocordycipitaceae sp.]DAJ12170.1 TPA_asm: cytochrome c oxidase subunit II [Ophiocordycipitaceae sp.]
MKNLLMINLDAPTAWGTYFQDSATPQMEGLVELHDNIMYYLVLILFSVGWILFSIIRNFADAQISHKYLNHGTLIELIWTITPAIILILIAFPSFKLLYLMDEVNDPSMTVLAEGHQWYWSYQYPDFIDSNEEFIEFDSYIIPESDLEQGGLRMLEVDNRVIVPELTHIRFVVTSGDVIHKLYSDMLCNVFCLSLIRYKVWCISWYNFSQVCGNFMANFYGLTSSTYILSEKWIICVFRGKYLKRVDLRLNQVSVFINREGVFYGQCSEICGILHSSMPIVIESVNIDKFVHWLYDA